jgi:hypothetical protein
MSRFGRGAKATAAQRAEVKRLASDGISVRKIAAAVFGDARYRGRVERILAAPSLGEQPPSVSLGDADLADICVDELDTTALIRLLFERRLARLTESPEPPSMSELRSLLDVQRLIEAAESVARWRDRPDDQPERAKSRKAESSDLLGL